MTEQNDDWSLFGAGVVVGILLGLVVLFMTLIGDTNGDTFVRGGVRYGRVCEKTVAISCGHWYIIGDAVEFVPTPPTPVVIEVVK